MNTQFEQYLALLESRAPADQKADFRAARELYLRETRTPQMEGAWWDRMFAGLGKKPSQSTFGGHSSDSYKNAESDTETKAKRKEHADEINKAKEDFPAAAKTVTTLATHEPGEVDAWVDYRLKPAIERAMTAGNAISDGDEFKKAEKETYKAAAQKYKEEDKKAKADEKKELKDALAYADEVEQTKKAEEKKAEEEKRLADAAKKREDLGKNMEYGKHDAGMAANSTDIDDNRTIATRKSDKAAAEKDADEKIRAAEKAMEERGEGYEGGTPMNATDLEKYKKEKEKEDAEKKKMADFADNFDFDKWGMADVAAVNIKGLRAAFESVYGDSSGFSDDEIRTICESCYRRYRK